MKPFFSLLVCLALISSTGAQRIVKNMKPTEQPGNVITNTVPSNRSIEARISDLLSLAASNRPKQGDTSKLVLIPLSYLNEAIQLSTAYNLHSQFYKASMDKLDILFHAGKIREMESMLLVDIDSLKAEVARYISRYYNDDHHVPRNISKAIEYASISLHLSMKMKDQVREINAHNQLGHIYRLSLRYSEAEEHFTKAIKLGKGIKQEHVAYSYICMIVINERKGYFNRALQYALEGIKYLEFTGTETWATDFYRIIGRIYYQLDDFEKSLKFIELSRSMSLRKSDIATFWVATQVKTEALLKGNKAQEALKDIEGSYKVHPPVILASQVNYLLSAGRIHTALANYKLAKNLMLRCLAINEDPTARPYILKSLADLHFAAGEYEMSKEHVDKALQGADGWAAINIAATHLLGYQVDSALGKFQSAMIHLKRNKQLTDSLNAVKRVRQIEELKIAFETDKILQDVQLKQQTIQLLGKQKELQARTYEESRLNFLLESKDKENHLLSLRAEATEKDKNILVNNQNISQLKIDNANRQANLDKARSTRNITFAFVGLLAIVMSLLYRQFKSKQAANRIIGVKNAELNNLLQEKEGLLEEKDWLLKEVHHRVKNNLQTVVSLLESQSVYLDSKALQANQESRNRVYAMSLVHQKLYQSENVASIEMDKYLSELVEHLRDSMETQKIYFKLQLIPVMLDVSQAISLGLIVNESITNSIKYAFPKTVSNPIIEITLESTDNGRLCLTTRDNGIGLTSDQINAESSSLGIKLMRGLTGDIMGDFTILSDNGTMVIVNFPPADPLSSTKTKKPARL